MTSEAVMCSFNTSTKKLVSGLEIQQNHTGSVSQETRFKNLPALWGEFEKVLGWREVRECARRQLPPGKTGGQPETIRRPALHLKDLFESKFEMEMSFAAWRVLLTIKLPLTCTIICKKLRQTCPQPQSQQGAAHTEAFHHGMTPSGCRQSPWLISQCVRSCLKTQSACSQTWFVHTQCYISYITL